MAESTRLWVSMVSRANSRSRSMAPLPIDMHTRRLTAARFKPDKENETIQYTGISQSAIREMSLCSELSHPNIIHLSEIILEEKCIFMVFEYCEHDLLQIIQHHSGSSSSSSHQQSHHTHTPTTPVSAHTSQHQRTPIPASAVKAMLWQLLNGVHYLHTNWVLHRDLKPANIMVTSAGAIRIGDLGLARIFHKPLNSLFSGDKVVVTIWYRAPELLLGAKHYTPAIDLWAVGCIFAELLSLRPIFKGEEAKLDNKKNPPFQRNQMQKIVEVLGMPRKENWPGLVHHYEYTQLQTLSTSARESGSSRGGVPSGLESWYNNTLASTGYPSSPPSSTPGPEGLDLLSKLLEYDPQKRLTAKQAMSHLYFLTEGDAAAVAGVPAPKPRDPKAPATVPTAPPRRTTAAVNKSMPPPPPPPASLTNVFHNLSTTYPSRRVSQDESDIRSASLPGTKRTGMAAGMAGPDNLDGGRAKKRARE